MPTYLRSLLADFPNGLDLGVFETQLRAGMVPQVSSVWTSGDDVYLDFFEELSGSDITTMDIIIANHVPPVYYNSAYIFQNPTTRRLVHNVDNESSITSTSTNIMELRHINSREIFICQDPCCSYDYQTVTEALAGINPSQTDVIINIYPGVYIETNPLVLPAGYTIIGQGALGSVVLVAEHNDEDFLILGSRTHVECITFQGPTGEGKRSIVCELSANNAYDKTLVKNCTIKDSYIGCDIYGNSGIAMIRSLEYVSSVSSYAGIIARNGAYVSSGQVLIAGNIGQTNIEHGIICQDSNTYLAVVCAGISSSINAITTKDGGQLSVSQGKLYDNTNAINIPSCTSSPIFTGDNICCLNNIHDIYVNTSHCVLNLTSSVLDDNKIYNPNFAQLTINSVSRKGLTNYGIMTGNLSIGTSSNSGTLTVGEGSYLFDNVSILSNNVLETGTFVDNSSIGNTGTDSGYDVFQGIEPDNCCYVGFPSQIVGLEVKVHDACSSTVSENDVVYEFWDGITWSNLRVMTNLATDPYTRQNVHLLSTASIHNVRFAIFTPVSKSINSITKYWIRMRIVNTLPSIPTLEYIKLHTNGTKLNKDGFVEYFGSARPNRSVDISPTSPCPDAQTHFLTKSLSFTRAGLSFSKSSPYPIYIKKSLDSCADVSCPFKITLSYTVDDTSSGNVSLGIRCGILNEGNSIYDNVDDAPTDTSLTSITLPISSNSNRKSLRAVLQFDISSLYDSASSIWISIERDTSDTYTGNMTIVDIVGTYTLWCNGEYISS